MSVVLPEEVRQNYIDKGCALPKWAGIIDKFIIGHLILHLVSFKLPRTPSKFAIFIGWYFTGYYTTYVVHTLWCTSILNGRKHLNETFHNR